LFGYRILSSPTKWWNEVTLIILPQTTLSKSTVQLAHFGVTPQIIFKTFHYKEPKSCSWRS